MVMIIDHRPGDFGDPSGWPFLGYGVQVPRILDFFQVPYVVAREPDELEAQVVRGGVMARASRRTTAILVGGDKT